MTRGEMMDHRVENDKSKWCLVTIVMIWTYFMIDYIKLMTAADDMSCTSNSIVNIITIIHTFNQKNAESFNINNWCEK